MKKAGILVIAGIICVIAAMTSATVPSDYAPVQYSTNGSTTAFTFGFPIFNTSDIKVILRTNSTGAENTLTETTDYAVSATNNDYSDGGTVTTVATHAAGYTLVIKRVTDQKQGSDYIPNTIPPGETLENADDLAVMIAQELQEQINRCIKYPETDSPVLSAFLPSSVMRASGWLYCGDTGTITTSSSVTPDNAIVSDFMETLIDDPDAGSARNTLGLYYDVKGYGAKGDGITNDTTAIQAAIDDANTAGGGTVYFPASSTNYIISGVLTLYDNIKLLGDHYSTSTIFLQASSDTQMANANSKDNITIKNLTFDGNNDNGNTQTLIWLTAAQNCEIVNCKITNTDNTAIYLISDATTNCENNTFHHNIIEDIGSVAIKIKAHGDSSDTKDTLYTKANYNYFYNCGYGAIEAYGQYCHYTEIIGNIAVECASGVYEADKGCSDVIIADNIAINSVTQVTFGDLGTIRVRNEGGYLARRVVVENNLIIGDSTEDIGGINLGGAEDVIIRGNQIYNIGTSAGAGIWIATTCKNVQILNNYIEGSKYKGIYVWSGQERILISGNVVIDTVGENIGSLSPAIITGNYCDEPGTSGIYIQNSTADRSIVSNNICKNGNNEESGIRAGIHLANIDNCVVTNNICYDDQGSATQDYGIYTSGTSTGNIIRNNQLSGNKTGTVSLVGANYTDETVGIITFTSTDATPTVGGGSVFITAGTTTITDFDDGYTGKIITVIAASSITITDGTNILLNSSANWAMTDTDTLTLLQKADGKWYEMGRGDNGA